MQLLLSIIQRCVVILTQNKIWCSLFECFCSTESFSWLFLQSTFPQTGAHLQEIPTIKLVCLWLSVMELSLPWSCVLTLLEFRHEVSDRREWRQIELHDGARCDAGSPVRTSICAEAASPFTTDLQAKYTRAPFYRQKYKVFKFVNGLYHPCSHPFLPFITKCYILKWY